MFFNIPMILFFIFFTLILCMFNSKKNFYEKKINETDRIIRFVLSWFVRHGTI